MKVLVLDDIKHRHDVFDRVYYDDQVVHCYRYHDFCDKLENDGPWDIVHLDHDLGDFVDDADTYYDGWGRKQEYNGQHAAAQVCEMDKPPPRIIIHSVNPVGARAMLQMIQRRGIPVTWEPFDDFLRPEGEE